MVSISAIWVSNVQWKFFNAKSEYNCQTNYFEPEPTIFWIQTFLSPNIPLKSSCMWIVDLTWKVEPMLTSCKPTLHIFFWNTNHTLNSLRSIFNCGGLALFGYIVRIAIEIKVKRSNHTCLGLILKSSSSWNEHIQILQFIKPYKGERKKEIINPYQAKIWRKKKKKE